MQSHETAAVFEFPKEFRRNWFQQLDMRYMIILLTTSVLQIGLLLWGLSSINKSAGEIDINDIQKRYANLLLNKSGDAELSFQNLEKIETYLFGVPEEIEPEPTLTDDGSIGSGHQAAEASGSALSESAAGSGSEVAIPSGLNERQKGRLTRKNILTGQVSSRGILAYLDEDNGNFDAVVTEILSQGQASSDYLEQSTANIKLAYYYRNGRNASTQSVNSDMAVKGGISEAPIEDMVNSHERLEKAEFESVAKNTEIEESPTSAIARAEKKGLVRNADHVTMVVNSHNRAIQDCFKQVLKNAPDAKGKVVVRFTVTPSGQVSSANILSSTIDDKAMLRCIVSRISRWSDFGECDPSIGEMSYRQTYVFGN
ncbi:MAG: AgmX/PglI C-terminal domain-containing protein [Candidatus Zhuqueibacterota bacterium]